MTPKEALRDIIRPALLLLPERMRGQRAECMEVAIGLQESGLNERVQRPLRPGMPNGPARGLWQFERGGGVRGVLRHHASSGIAERLCEHLGYRPEDEAGIWAGLEHDDILAAVFARLLLWTDPQPLPSLGDPNGAWQLYLRVWRPGKPHIDRWPANYDAALEAVRAQAP